MKLFWRAISIVTLTASIAGCGAKSPMRSSPQQELTTDSLTADRQETDASAKIDIVFVVDNSLSMAHHQEDLVRNIPQFVEKFTSKPLIDFHIGVITIWDADSDPARQAALAKEHPKGQLIPLRTGDFKTIPKPGETLTTPYLVNGVAPPPWVTRDTPDLNTVLSSTILLGESWVPHFEEMFSPVVEFFSSANQNGFNKGFYRPDAHLLVVFITDANDGTVTIGADQLYDFLLSLKGGQRDKLHMYAILAPFDSGCKEDEAGPPFKFETLKAYLDGTILSMCSPNFGSDLANFGETLSVKVGRQVIGLKRTPDRNQPVTVSYGSQIIPEAQPPNYDDGWSYDDTGKKIVLGPKIKLNREPGAKIKIDFTPVEFQGILDGNVTPMTVAPPPTASAPAPAPAGPAKP